MNLNFPGPASSNMPVSAAADNERNGPFPAGEGARTANQGSASFCFGARRYATKGPRRLFVPQGCPFFPAFDTDLGSGMKFFGARREPSP